MGKFAVEIPVADWEISLKLYYLKILDCFQHHHLIGIRGCKDLLGHAQQYYGIEKMKQ